MASTWTQSVRTHDDLSALRKEWSELHRLARPGSPFEHPGWAETWARRFVPDGDLECVVVRDRDANGELIGFAPFYRCTRRLAGVRMTAVRPLGMGRRDGLTEVVQVVAKPELARQVLRAVVRHVERSPGWTWFQLSLAPDQGWLVPQWLEHPGEAVILHRAARPCVVLPDLPVDRDAVRAGLKRNVRESVRRSQNRARKLGGVRTRVLSEPHELAAGLAGLIELHHERSGMGGKVEHGDLFDDEPERGFLADAVQSLAEEGLARIHVAEHHGRMVAGQLVLSDGSTDYLSVSGLDPAYWDLSLNTLLIFEAMATATDLRRCAFNLSTGPDTAKTRWSEAVEVFHDFAVVRGDRRSRWLFQGYAHVGVALAHRQARRRHQVRAGSSGPGVWTAAGRRRAEPATRPPGAPTAPDPGGTMDLRTALRATRRRWLVVVIMMVVFGGAAAAVTMSATPEYSATSRGLVSVSAPETRQQYVLANGSQYITDRMTSYAQLGVTSQVLTPVVEDLRLLETPLTLSGRVTSSSQVDTALLLVEARHTDPVLAAAIADDTMRHLGEAIQELEGGKVAVAMAGPAAVPTQPSNLPVLLVALFAAFVGLVLGLAVVLVRAAVTGDGRPDQPTSGEARPGEPTPGDGDGQPSRETGPNGTEAAEPVPA